MAAQIKKKCLLVTGATGYLGQFVVQRLASTHKASPLQTYSKLEEGIYCFAAPLQGPPGWMFFVVNTSGKIFLQVGVIYHSTQAPNIEGDIHYFWVRNSVFYVPFHSHQMYQSLSTGIEKEAGTLKGH